MLCFVITITNNPDSVKVANRCIESGKPFGVDIRQWPAFTPEDDPRGIFEDEGLPIQGFFGEEWSYPANAMAAFLSHRSLWKHCHITQQPVLILEHDAVIINDLPDPRMLGMVTSLGAPSYGKFNIPPRLGLNMLTSKPYFPGAHGYIVRPRGAEELLHKAHECAAPTDVFLSVNNFAWLQEWYPWPIEARDTFTTIQKEAGCRAKHSYQKDPEKYKIL